MNYEKLYDILQTATMSNVNIERMTTTEKKSVSMKSYHAYRKLQSLLGFDLGDIMSLNAEQMEIRNNIYSVGTKRRIG